METIGSIKGRAFNSWGSDRKSSASLVQGLGLGVLNPKP